MPVAYSRRKIRACAGFLLAVAVAGIIGTVALVAGVICLVSYLRARKARRLADSVTSQVMHQLHHSVASASPGEPSKSTTGPSVTQSYSPSSFAQHAPKYPDILPTSDQAPKPFNDTKPPAAYVLAMDVDGSGKGKDSYGNDASVPAEYTSGAPVSQEPTGKCMLPCTHMAHP